MKIVFVSNYYNHHQAPLCRELNRLAEEFRFVATSEMRAERRALGYGMDTIPDFVRYAHRGEAERQECLELIRSADVVIAGSAPESLFRDRIRAGKLIFRYSERLLKRDLSPLKLLLMRVRLQLRNPNNKPIFLLCAGAYAASDFAQFGLFRNKAYRWGYFPEADAEENPEHREPGSILWAGRLIDWKHPEQALDTAKRLKESGRKFTLRIIGNGVLETQLQQMIQDADLSDCVQLLGALKPREVRRWMNRSEIFLFNSDKQEGWGAVLNEAMSSGCAVVASHAIGAVPYLLKDGKNGLIYRSGNKEMLYEKTAYLLDNPGQREALGGHARETIVSHWNAEIAASRLCELAGRILAGEKNPVPYKSGPCSLAPVLSDDCYPPDEVNYE